MLKTLFFFYEDAIWFLLIFFRETWLYAWKQNILFYFLFLFLFLTKTRYLIPDLYLYSIKIQINTNQNAVKYLRKIIDFWKDFFYFRAGPNPAHVAGLDPATPCGWAGPSQPTLVTGPSQWPNMASDPTSIHARVIFYACMNSAKVIKLPSHCSSSLQMARTGRCNWSCWFHVLAPSRFLFVFLTY